ncbi:MAG: TolC family protein [Pseudomonadota bacterium]
MIAAAGAALTAGPARADEGDLTLDAAIRMSLDAPQVRAAHEAVNQARADVKIASVVPNPSAAIGADGVPLDRQYLSGEPGGPTELDGEFSVPLDWLLFGKRAAAQRAANSGVRAAEAEYADVVRQCTAETSEDYYDVLEAQAQLEAATQSRAGLEQAAAAIETAVASGGRPQVELSRVRLELQAARREERSAEAAVVSAKAALQARIGDTGSAAGLRIAGSLDGPLTATRLAVEQAFSIAVEQRPDIAALRLRVEQARQEATLEGRNAWPETSLALNVAHQPMAELGAPDMTAGGVSLEMALPFFDRNQGNRARAASVAAQAEQELAAALNDLHAEVEQAEQSLGSAFDNAIEMSRTDLELATQVRDSIQTAYEVGGRPLIELLDAQRSYRETYNAFISSRAEYWRALARYQAALGKKVTQ